ncbi:EboA domain-containing protein [Streptomyces uncialis]|uniref:EboA domain-containing protein n=1 Tax=Streptomyces uncialis TaxID=1048205 RepID=UPI00225A98F3|nr:EboA domain-containing protein [Streptomyces uncialis]MCX4658966.1 EboA domain-containing protein [Streptomyces uncialis]
MTAPVHLPTREELGAALSEAARAWLDRALTEAGVEAETEVGTAAGCGSGSGAESGAGAGPAAGAGAAVNGGSAAVSGAASASVSGAAPVSGAGSAYRAGAAAVPGAASAPASGVGAAYRAGAVPGPGQSGAARGAARWEALFAQAGRRCGHEHADAVRVLLLRAAHPGPETLTRLYGQGTAAERRAVLLALPALVPGPAALPLVRDALRTNDTRLVAAAVGPYTAVHLDAHEWRHAVLKCLFTGVPVTAVAALAERARGDTELARMLDDQARERTAAGRPVPDDLRYTLTLTAPRAATATGEES